MNILADENNNKKYVFHIEDLLGNILFTLKLNSINPTEISLDLLEKYICILLKKYTEDGLKSEFILTEEEIQRFIKDHKDIYARSDEDNRKILLLREMTVVDLAKRYHNAMPFKVLNATVNGEVQKRVIEAYNDEKTKVLEKKTSN